MKILFDGQATQSTQQAIFHGGGEYAKFILRTAIEKKCEFDIVFSSKMITDPAIENLLKQNPQYRIQTITEKQELYDLIERGGYKIFYSALPYKYTDYHGSATLLGVIHGLRSIELPWDEYRYKYYNKWYKRGLAYLISRIPPIQAYLKTKHIRENQKLLSIPNAKFITVSHHSKYALLNFYPNLREDDIKVFYSPFSIIERSTTNTITKDYYLMVSGNRYEKNIFRAVQAFDQLFSKGYLPGKRVIITGCGKQPFWKQIKNQDRFKLYPYVSTEELEKLYREAFCFIYPSLNEGFGYPPLKAMGYGVPVIASSATSIPEVCSYAACYFNPTSIDDLSNRILQIDLTPNLRQELTLKGEKRVKELLNIQQQSLENMIEFLFYSSKKQ